MYWLLWNGSGACLITCFAQVFAGEDNVTLSLSIDILLSTVDQLYPYPLHRPTAVQGE